MTSRVDDLEAAAALTAASGTDVATKQAYVQRMFSDIAPTYDLLNRVFSLNIDQMWRSAALRELEWTRNPAGTYLDLCAGTLDVSAMLARRAGFRGRVISADFAEPMLRAGSKKVSGLAVRPVAADAQRLPMADGVAAGAIVAFGIRNVADLDVGLREVRRVLAPGGRFVILEFSTPRLAIVRHTYHLYFHHILPVIGGWISGHPTAYRYLPKSVSNFPIEEALADRMRAAGFSAVRWRTLTLGVAAIHVGVK
jgi:demethylmenaquinone methyltransferase/2-methoxy-6-polyprenyl-1,4-benzoquinol methylase